ncbi:hypothetical protein ADM96_19570 [Burkholderia sp. ST111]|nr:hypothetical protein ADM96_19570 [Burkholderia sp. ST111]
MKVASGVDCCGCERFGGGSRKRTNDQQAIRTKEFFYLNPIVTDNLIGERNSKDRLGKGRDDVLELASLTCNDWSTVAQADRDIRVNEH